MDDTSTVKSSKIKEENCELLPKKLFNLFSMVITIIIDLNWKY